MINKAKTIAQADANSAVEDAITLAKSRVSTLASTEIDEVSGGLKVTDPTDGGITAGLISPDVVL